MKKIIKEIIKELNDKNSYFISLKKVCAGSRSTSLSSYSIIIDDNPFVIDEELFLKIRDFKDKEDLINILKNNNMKN